MLEKLLEQYMRMFGESFPTAEYRGNEDGLIEALKESIETKTKHEPDYEKDALY